MDTTEHYGLKKPGAEDFYNVQDQNGNMDAIDAALNGLEQGKASLGADGKVPAAQLPEMDYEAPLKTAPAKETPTDADALALVDAGDGKTRKLLWSRVKAILKGWFDTLYAAAGHTHDPVQVGGIPIVTTYTPEGGVDGVDYAADVPGVEAPFNGLGIRVILHKTTKTTLPMLHFNGLAGKEIRRRSSHGNNAATEGPTTVWLQMKRAVNMQYDAPNDRWIVTDMPAVDGKDLINVTAGSYLVGTGGFGMQELTAKEVGIDVVGAATWAASIGTGWTADPEGGWKQEIAMAGLPEARVKIGPDYTGLTRAEAERVRRDFAKVSRIGVEAGKLTAWCWYQQPAGAIPISITM